MLFVLPQVRAGLLQYGIQSVNMKPVCILLWFCIVNVVVEWRQTSCKDQASEVTTQRAAGSSNNNLQQRHNNLTEVDKQLSKMRVFQLPLVSLALVFVFCLANLKSSFSAVQPPKNARQEEHSPNGLTAEITSCPG